LLKRLWLSTPDQLRMDRTRINTKKIEKPA
jgi:hypothetical protein